MFSISQGYDSEDDKSPMSATVDSRASNLSSFRFEIASNLLPHLNMAPCKNTFSV